MINPNKTIDNSEQTANNTTPPPPKKPQEIKFINPLAAFSEQLANFFDNLPRIELPKFAVISPLTEYSAALDAIADKMRVCENITEHAAEYAAEYAAAKDNYFYLEALADLEAAELEAKQATDRAEAADREAAELRRRVVSQEKLFATIPLIIPTPKQPKPAATTKQTAATLNPLITPSQIGQIHAATKGIFTATIEHWRALFAETQIVMDEPIKAATPSDIAIFLYYLKEHEVINTNRYAIIVERAKAFKINNKFVTAKQLQKVKENYNFPDNVRNSDKLQQIAYTVRPRKL